MRLLKMSKQFETKFKQRQKEIAESRRLAIEKAIKKDELQQEKFKNRKNIQKVF